MNSRDIFPEMQDPFSLPSISRCLARYGWHRLNRLWRQRIARVGRGTQPSYPRVMDYRQECDGRPRGQALVAYIAEPLVFTPERRTRSHHSNWVQVVEIVHALNRLGFAVDVVDAADDMFVPRGNYDILLGESRGYGRLLSLLGDNTLRIFYGTRSHWTFEKTAREERLASLASRRRCQLTLSDWSPSNDWVERSDAVVLIGNDFTASTYNGRCDLVCRVDNTALITSPPPNLDDKDYAAVRKHFLWLGSAPLLHKGLDLVLEAFVQRPDLHLWVCGPLDKRSELPFVWEYHRELFCTPNIHPMGFVPPASELFSNILDRCGYMIYPSCSEGMAGSVLAAMYRGLLPIITREVGVDIEDGVGLCLPRPTVDAVAEAVGQMAEFPIAQLRFGSSQAHRQAITRYSLEAFASSVQNSLASIWLQCRGSALRATRDLL